MSEAIFKLGTFARSGEKPFVGLVMDGRVIDLATAHAAFGDSAKGPRDLLASTATVLDLLEDWDRNFAVLWALAGFIAADGIASDRFKSSVFGAAGVRVLPPILRPSKILNTAANYSGHLAEMRDSQYAFGGGVIDKAKHYSGDKTKAQPYLFLKAPSALAGAFDDIVSPAGGHHLDWEVEIALAIGKPGRRIRADAAHGHIAGYMTSNDLSCRTMLWRDDRPNFKSDWLSSKSHDTFAPMGPFLVPRAFVPDSGAVALELKVNGEIKQKGIAGEMIFSPEEQIEYASRNMTLQPGDIISTGTIAGVGQGTNTFLKVGDIVEAEAIGLGKQRNRVIADAP